MFEYMTAQEAAELWGISVRRVQRLCKENRIEGVLNINRMWLIPKSSKKPVDKRRKVTDYGEFTMRSLIPLSAQNKAAQDLYLSFPMI